VEKGIDLADAKLKQELAHEKLVQLAKSSTWKGDGKFNRSYLYDRKIFS
jgi:hypothetical protein